MQNLVRGGRCSLNARGEPWPSIPLAEATQVFALAENPLASSLAAFPPWSVVLVQASSPPASGVLSSEVPWPLALAAPSPVLEVEFSASEVALSRLSRAWALAVSVLAVSPSWELPLEGRTF